MCFQCRPVWTLRSTLMSGSYAYLVGSFTSLPDGLAAARRLLGASERLGYAEAYVGTRPEGVARFTGMPVPTEVRFVVDEPEAALAASLFGATVDTVHRGGVRTMAARLDGDVAAALTRLTDVLVDVELGGPAGSMEDAFCERIGEDSGDISWECEWPGAVRGGNGVYLTINGSGLYRENSGSGHELHVFVSDADGAPDAVAARAAGAAGLTVGERSHEG